VGVRAVLARVWDRLTYWAERRFVQGAQYQLALIAAMIGLLSILGGAAVLVAGSGFDDVGEAVWWAFLRLTDPGYLGDDVGAVNRVVSTVMTVLGYVVFLGALVAVMTQWLNSRMDRLERGLTKVARNNHILVLGWTNRTQAIVRELLLSEGRVKRFLTRHGSRELHVVVLAEGVGATLAQDLRDAVGTAWDEDKVTLRSGTPLRVEHLDRVDTRNAAVVIVPGSEFEAGGIGRTDSFTIKTLLSIQAQAAAAARVRGGRSARSDTALPYVVAEIFDARKIGVARKAYGGRLEVVASDAVVSRLLAQNVRHPGLSHVYNEILTHEGGSEIYLREHRELDGLRFGNLGGAFEDSILLGVVRSGDEGHVPYLNPPADFEVFASDRFVHLAKTYADTEFAGVLPAEPWPRGRPGTPDATGVDRRILVLGWNHKVPALVKEFGTYAGGRFHVRILSTAPLEAREKALDRYGVRRDHVSVENVEGDLAELGDLQDVDPTSFDSVLLVGSDRIENDDESDARTIIGSLLLGEIGLPSERTQTIVELLDPENVRLLDSSSGEVIISPLILSHMLAHVALRPELGAVFTELFTSGGAEITFVPLRSYFPSHDEAAPVTFTEVQRAVHAVGEIALGVREGEGVVLNPAGERRYWVRADTKVVTMVTYE
jgi:ion channel POLLUX/CASTOR